MATCIDVDAITVRIDLQIIDREIVDAGRENGEVPAVQDGDVANNDVAAEPEADRFISPAGPNGVARVGITEWRLWFAGARIIQRVDLFLRARLRAAAHQSTAPDTTRTENGNVLEVLAPNQTVVPVTVTEILISIPLIWLRRIVRDAFARLCRDNRRTLIEVERDIAFQMNGD